MFKMQLITIIVVLLSVTCKCQQSSDNSTVKVSLARPDTGYIGRVETIQGIKAVASFKGIPYGVPPVDDLRFKPPVPFEENAIRNAAEFAAPCLQWDLFRNENVTGSEDCLYLNVYVLHDHLTSRSADSPFQPVMVFFHGVGFIHGQSDTYNPEYLVQKGVIVVTVQYRLGSLGFLSTGDKEQPGNQGMLDQVEALKWVKKNINRFGGDKDNVVIFGESVGAVAVSLHLISPLTKGLFRAAIIQSGSAIAPYAIQRSPMTHVQRLAANLGCLSGSTETLLKCIRSADPVEIVAKDANSVSSGSDRKASRSHKKPPNPGPVVQTEAVPNWPVYLSEDPESALIEGHFHKVPVVIGVNRDESASAVISNLLPRLINATETVPFYAERVFLRKVIRASGIVNNTEMAKTAIKFEYFKNYNMSDILELKDEFISLHSDFSVIAPVYRTAMHLSQRTPVYFYTFDYEGELSFSEYLLQPSTDLRERRAELEAEKQSGDGESKMKSERQLYNYNDPSTGATAESSSSSNAATSSIDEFDAAEDRRHVIHGEELLYLFRFRNPSTKAIVDVEDEEGILVRDIMTSLWTNVAKYGSPTPAEDVARNDVNGLEDWKAFTPLTPNTYKITSKPSLISAYRHRKMLFWTSYIPQLQSLDLCG